MRKTVRSNALARTMSFCFQCKSYVPLRCGVAFPTSLWIPYTILSAGFPRSASFPSTRVLNQMRRWLEKSSPHVAHEEAASRQRSHKTLQ
eukprot:IDg16948t1